MIWINLLVFLHVMAAFAMVAGILGRQIARNEVRKANDLKTFINISSVAGRFENLLVIPGSTLVILAGILLAVIEGWPMLGFLQGGASNWLLVSNLLVVSIIAVIVLVFVPRGKVYEKALSEAMEKGEITPELRATFDDPVVRWGHRWEEIALVLIIFLMVVKPF